MFYFSKTDKSERLHLWETNYGDTIRSLHEVDTFQQFVTIFSKQKSFHCGDDKFSFVVVGSVQLIKQYNDEPN